MRPPNLYIKNTTIHLLNGEAIKGNLFIKNGTICSIEPRLYNGTVEPSAKIIDGNNLHAIPGFIDTHIHGASGADVMDATTDALDTIATALTYEGTTSFLATTMTQSKEVIETALHNIAVYKNKPGKAELLGIHLEGPFIEKSKAGAQPAEHILKPNIELFNKWQNISGKNIRTVTMAPEHDPNGEFITTLTSDEINVSAGHTNSNFTKIKRAASFGVSQLTHLCNAMTGVHHREVGAVGSAFLLKELKAELIADGIHVAPEMLRLIYEQMGSRRIILITDSMRAKGLPNGKYELANQPVTVTNEKAVLADGTLAGSVLTMQKAAKNMMEITGATITDIIKMTAENPARQIGVFARMGSITFGKDADLLLVDDELNIKYTICKGWITSVNR